jgi:hypothetical protein
MAGAALRKRAVHCRGGLLDAIIDIAGLFLEYLRTDLHGYLSYGSNNSVRLLAMNALLEVRLHLSSR